MRATSAAHAAPRSRPAALLVRAIGLLALWIVLIGAKPVDLLMGVPAAGAAAWLSVRLLPPSMLTIRLLPLLALVPRFLWQSLVAGWDVARRAFDPRLPLKPGLLTYRTGLPPGAQRNAFTGYTSLLPGTVPCGSDAHGVVYHCLDTGQPVLEELVQEEQRLARVFVARAGSVEDRDA